MAGGLTENNIQAPRDQNFVPAALFEIDGSSPPQVMPGQINQSTGRILVEGAGGFANFQNDVYTSSANETIFFTSQGDVSFDFGMYINGLRQTPGVDYTLVGGGSEYVLTAAVPAGSIVILTYSY
jgi:hypothetical protein